MLPPRLSAGSHVRIIAPSCTLASVEWMTEELWKQATDFYTSKGIHVEEGKYLRERDNDDSASIKHRLTDLHDAFRDPTVHALHCIRGGWNVNQLLSFIDYDLIKKNPKILCGFSDITALGNAIYAKTGLTTYSGPNFNQFAFGPALTYTYEHYEKAIMQSAPIDIMPAPKWTDDYFDPKTPWKFPHTGEWWVVHEGSAKGTSFGGNLCTLNLLQGTEYMPMINDSILFIEDDHETHPRTFDRDLTSLTQQPWFDGVRGILFGRCQTRAVNRDFGPITKEILLSIIERNPRLKNIPIIANVDFGHTYPIFTFPIGGTVEMNAEKGKARIVINEH